MTVPEQPTRVRHWRTFGRAEWRHVGDGVLGFVFGQALPLLSFYLALKFLSFTAAVLIVLAWSTVVFGLHLRRTREADIFSAATFAFALLEAIVGLWSQNLLLYLATPSLKNLIYALAFLGSAFVGRPLLGLYGHRLYPVPVEVQQSATYRRAFEITSFVWAGGLTLRGLARLTLMATLPLELYLVVDNTVVGWSFSMFLVSFSVWFPLRRLRQAGLIHETVPVDAGTAGEQAAAVATTP
jgi:intracellular septation protein A